MVFLKVVQIDSLDELKELESTLAYAKHREIADDHLSSRFTTYDPETDEEIPDPDNPFEPGRYFIWYEESFDRMGDTKICAIERIPDETPHVKDICKQIRFHTDKYHAIAIKLDQLRVARDNKDEKKMSEIGATISDEEWDYINENSYIMGQLGFSVH